MFGIVKKYLILIVSFLFLSNIHSQNSDTVSISILGVGDVMLGTSFPSVKHLPPNNNCSKLLEDVAPVIMDADIAMCNLEGCFLDSGPVVKKCKDTTICYAFRTPEKYFQCVVNAGFNLFCLANNHSNDFGSKGINSTLKLIDENELNAAGLLIRPKVVFEQSGLKIGFCAFSPNKGTTRINDYIKVKSIINELEKEVDIVIVSFHGGAEGKDHQHIKRKKEIFYGENRSNVYEFARIAIDAGADVVFGHGPHVSRAIDLYKDRFIAYSLGNFCTYDRINITGVNGYAPMIKVSVNSEGEFQQAEIMSAIQYKYQGTFIDSQNRAAKIIKQLTNEDIPESELKISDAGLVTR